MTDKGKYPFVGMDRDEHIAKHALLDQWFSVRLVTGTGAADPAVCTYLCDATLADMTLTLPYAGLCTSRIYTIKKTDATANTVTIEGLGAETIDGDLTLVIQSQYDSVFLFSDSTNWHIV